MNRVVTSRRILHRTIVTVPILMALLFAGGVIHSLGQASPAMANVQEPTAPRTQGRKIIGYLNDEKPDFHNILPPSSADMVMKKGASAIWTVDNDGDSGGSVTIARSRVPARTSCTRSSEKRLGSSSFKSGKRGSRTVSKVDTRKGSM